MPRDAADSLAWPPRGLSREQAARHVGRWAGICTIMYQDVQMDLAAGLVQAGLGRDCPRYSGGRYRALERPAAAAMPLPSYCVRR